MIPATKERWILVENGEGVSTFLLCYTGRLGGRMAGTEFLREMTTMDVGND
jgi:hypothetical protein